MSNNVSKLLEVVLTRSCNYNCSWCNQRYDLTRPMQNMDDLSRRIVNNNLRSGKEWVEGLNDYPYKNEYDKLVFSGGEPSLHPDFFEIVAKVNGYKSIIIVTNLSFDISKLINACRDANSHLIIQPSFHFEFASFRPFIEKIKALDRYHLLSHLIPVSIVGLPDRREPGEFKQKFKKRGYHASLYKFQGYYKGKFISGDIKGFGSLGDCRPVYCHSSTNFVCPNGDMVFCMTDSYSDGVNTFGNMCDKVYKKIENRRVCKQYGACHIASEAWVKVDSLETGKTIWKGKNFLNKNPLVLFRIYCERKNYRWLSRIKNLSYNFSLLKEKIRKRKKGVK